MRNPEKFEGQAQEGEKPEVKGPKGIVFGERVRAERERLIEEYKEKTELSPKAQELIERYLREEKDKLEIEFAKTYFKDHKDELKEQGYNVKSKEVPYILRVVNEVNGWKALETDEKYKEFSKEIDNTSWCLEDLEKGLSIAGNHFVLYKLERKNEELKKEMERAREKGDQVGFEAKKKEIEELFNVRKEMVEKLTQKDLRKEAEKEIEALENKDQYLSKYFEEEMKKLNTIDDYCQKLGWRIEKAKRGYFYQNLLVDAEGKTIETFNIWFGRKGELRKYLKEKTEEKIRNDLEKEWEKLNSEREEKIREFIEREIRSHATNPEKAIELIKQEYAKAKEKEIKNLEEFEIKPKSQVEEEANRMVFGKGEAKNPGDLIETIREIFQREIEKEKLKEEMKELFEKWFFSEEMKERLKGVVKELLEEFKKEFKETEEEKIEGPKGRLERFEDWLKEKSEWLYDKLYDALIRKRGFDWLFDKLWFFMFEWQFLLIESVVGGREFRRFKEREAAEKREAERRERVRRGEITEEEAERERREEELAALRAWLARVERERAERAPT